jgi:hypothetical protein
VRQPTASTATHVSSLDCVMSDAGRECWECTGLLDEGVPQVSAGAVILDKNA